MSPSLNSQVINHVELRIYFYVIYVKITYFYVRIYFLKTMISKISSDILKVYPRIVSFLTYTCFSLSILNIITT